MEKKKKNVIEQLDWRVIVNGKIFGDNVSFGKRTIEISKKGRKKIRTIIENAWPVLQEQAIYSIQKIITGKTEIDDIIQKAEKLSR